MQPPSNGLVSLACRPIPDSASSLHERREQGACLSDRPLVLSGPKLREPDDHRDGARLSGVTLCCDTRLPSSLLPDEILLGATASLPLGSLWFRSVRVNPRSQYSLLHLLLFGDVYGMAV